ncbi:MAG: hypothetical protein U0263_08725 [Polyangiaceae bacterium]
MLKRITRGVVGSWLCFGLAGCGSDPTDASTHAAPSSGGVPGSGGGGVAGGIGEPVTGGTGGGGSASSSGGIKLHGGNYVWPDIKYDDTYSTYRLDHPGVRQKLLDFIDTIKDEPNITGVQVAVYWKALEGDTKGDYGAGFASLDIVLDQLAAYGKHLNLSFSPQVFGGFAAVTDVFPQYVVDDYGVTPTGFGELGGMTSRTWQKETMDQIIRVVKAYGERYDGHPAFETITGAETSMQVPDGLDGFGNHALLEQFLRLIPATRQAFPHSAVRVGANDMSGDDSLLVELMAACQVNACAVGGPDIWPADVTQADRIFVGLNAKHESVFADYRDVMPWHVEAQWQSFVGGKGQHFTMAELFGAVEDGYSAPMCDEWDPSTYACTHTFDFARPPMKARYLTWYANTYEMDSQTLTWQEEILPFLRTHGPAHAQDCPSSYQAFGGCKLD